MSEPLLAALIRAWHTAMIATSALTVALALRPFWDTAIYVSALKATLATNF